MRLKRIVILSFVSFSFIFFIVFFVIFSSSNDNNSSFNVDGLSVSSDVLKYESLVEKYAKKYGISEYVNYLLAIMQVESGGKGNDVMQASESENLPVGSLTPEESINQGCKYFASLLEINKKTGCDINTVIQAYNYGAAFIVFVSSSGKKYTFELAENFASNKCGGSKQKYTDPIAVKKNGGWKYTYGNMFYVLIVTQYITAQKFDNKTVQAIMNEALKYQGYPYVFGGNNPTTSFDCSGLVQWCYGKAGINLPRTAQEQYDTTQHISLSQAKPGDLVFFKGTYNAGTYITHVGIYVGNNRMYAAGDPIGYADLTSSYWQEHLVCAGRVQK